MRKRLFSFFPSLHVLKACLNLLDRRDRFLLLGATVLQMSLVLLDLIGILLIGGIVAIATSAVQGKDFPQIISSFIEIVGLEAWTPQDISVLFAVIATLALLGKSSLSYYFNLRNLTFLASREAKLATNMAEKIFSQPITVLQSHSTSDYLHSLSIGANSALTGILGGLVTMSAEIFLQLVMASTLMVFSPSLLLIFFTYFGILFLILHFVLGTKAQDWSRHVTELSIMGSAAIMDSLGSYREIVVSGRRKFFLDRFRAAKWSAGQYTVKNAMLGQFSKYVFENSIVIGGAIFAAYAFLTRNALEATSLLAVFLAAATRIAPSILRVQLGMLLIKGALGATSKFFEIYSHVMTSNTQRRPVTNAEINLGKGIEVRDVTFFYPRADKPALKEVSCTFLSNKVTAVVGPSGSGKSTLIDLLLGVLEPLSGNIEVFGVSPSSLVEQGVKVGYVPQTVYLKDGSIRENICFGFEENEINEQRVLEVLEDVLLMDWVNSLPNGVDSVVGERGSKLSGGQRQRIGIARALYSSPDLLVLDEATSALDSISEHEITETLGNIKNEMTTVVIAHRLSTVLRAEKLIYLNNGKVKGEGSFNELRVLVPNFDLQAELMGIAK